MLANVAGCPALADATLFVDDFYDFTAYERKLLAAVAAAVGRTEVALLLDPDDPAAVDLDVPPSEMSVFHRTLRAYRGLRAAMKGLPIEPSLTLRTVHRPPALAAVERRPVPPGRPRVPRGRGQAAIDVFRRPRRPGRGGRRRPADPRRRRRRHHPATATCALLVRSLADYQEIVDASFGEHGIRYFADHRRTARHHPLLQMVRGCLLVARSGWPTDAAMTLAKCGLVGLTDDAADELENYVLQSRVRGRPPGSRPSRGRSAAS